MTAIIKAENLGKQFRLGRRADRYSTLRESLSRAVRKPMEVLREAKRNGSSDFWALRDVNFEILPGEVVGIIGRNGAGKSTLLKILSRITEPTIGRVELFGRVGSLLEVGTGFHPELTGRENIYLNGAILGMRHNEIARKFDQITDFAEIEDFLETPVKRYSSGMYTRLAFAVAAHLESEILVVDEVLAVGDAEFQEKCLGKMKDVSQNGRTVLFVSHNMNAIKTLCPKCILLEKGEIVSRGDTESVVGDYLNTARSNFKTYNRILKWVKIDQVGDEIVLECEYEGEEKINRPILGFVIRNSVGTPVYGSNPFIDKLDFSEHRATKSGYVKVVIKQPKLLDGEYWISLWFGNSNINFFEEQDALSLNISGMTNQLQYSASVVGNVLPECEWSFE